MDTVILLCVGVVSTVLTVILVSNCARRDTIAEEIEEEFLDENSDVMQEKTSKAEKEEQRNDDEEDEERNEEDDEERNEEDDEERNNEDDDDVEDEEDEKSDDDDDEEDQDEEHPEGAAQHLLEDPLVKDLLQKQARFMVDHVSDSLGNLPAAEKASAMKARCSASLDLMRSIIQKADNAAVSDYYGSLLNSMSNTLNQSIDEKYSKAKTE